MTISDMIDEAPGVRTFRLNFLNEDEGKNFKFQTGQFGLYSVFGAGESTFCIASSPTRGDYIECTFREAGRVTKALRELNIGDTLGFRGPYGNVFPIEKWEGKNLVFIAGGIALPPLRSVIWNCLDLREKYEDVTIIYGAKTIDDLVYKNELKEWDARADVNLVTTVDPGGETPEWTGKVGFVPTVVEETAPVCGPPIMIKFTLPVLEKLGFKHDEVYTTLENRMKCGLGKCGRCNIGCTYVCKEGPVFTAEEISKMPDEF